MGFLSSKKSTNVSSQDNRIVQEEGNAISGNSGTINIEDVSDEVLDQFVAVTQEAFGATKDALNSSRRSQTSLENAYTKSLAILSEDKQGTQGAWKIFLPVAAIAGIALYGH